MISQFVAFHYKYLKYISIAYLVISALALLWLWLFITLVLLGFGGILVFRYISTYIGEKILILHSHILGPFLVLDAALFGPQKEDG